MTIINHIAMTEPKLSASANKLFLPTIHVAKAERYLTSVYKSSKTLEETRGEGGFN